MRILFLIGIVALFFIPFQVLHAQADFALLEKNVNVRAATILHELNKTKDTLLLSSDKIINKVYSVNMNYKREIDTYINEYSYKVPLTQLTKGKHVFVVVQSPLKIIFVVRILKDKLAVVTPVYEELTISNSRD